MIRQKGKYTSISCCSRSCWIGTSHEKSHLLFVFLSPEFQSPPTCWSQVSKSIMALSFHADSVIAFPWISPLSEQPCLPNLLSFSLGFQAEKAKGTSLMAHRLIINNLHVPCKAGKQKNCFWTVKILERRKWESTYVVKLCCFINHNLSFIALLKAKSILFLGNELD